ncbi:MAG TPA: peptidylprolyl isomerase [Candidatus Eisenbacteria bacterium]
MRRSLARVLLPLALAGAARTAAAASHYAARGAELAPAAAIFETSQGRIVIRLFPADAPRTVANFRKLVRAGFYDSLTFHRVVPGFVIQGGDPNSRDENPFNDGQGGPGYTLPAEIKRRHERGAVAMARLPDAENPARESNGSQFYIALRDLPQLDGGYTVFGKVIAGWEAIDRIVTLASRTDIARVGNNANPGRLALIRHASLAPLPRAVTPARRGPGR